MPGLSEMSLSMGFSSRSLQDVDRLEIWSLT